MRIHIKNSGGYALFLALLPVVMMYKVPGVGMGVSTVLIALGMIYAGTCILMIPRSFSGLGFLVPLYIYFVYVMTKSPVENILLCIAILVHLTAIAAGAVDAQKLKKYMVFLSLLASSLVIVQLLVHTLTGFHIPCINYRWCLDSMSSYRSAIQTGIPSVEKIYRPSSIFLEPAHLAQYCIMGLIMCLFDREKRIKEAIVISLGILCTTSGMGIVLVLLCWGWWFMYSNERLTQARRIQRMLLGCVAAVVVYAVLMRIPFFRGAIGRITGTASGGYNAINGRFFWWDTYFGGRGWKELLYGFGLNALPGVYFTGFMEQLYAYGIVGFVLFVVALLFILKKSGSMGKLLTVIYIALLFFANLTGFISIVFNLGVIIAINGCEKRRDTDMETS